MSDVSAATAPAAPADPTTVDQQTEKLLADLAQMKVQRQAGPNEILGTDVSGPIMDYVKPVSTATKIRLNAMIAQANALIDLMGAHEKAVEEYLEARDAQVKNLLKRHLEFAVSTDAECTRMEDALNKIKQDHSTIAGTAQVIQDATTAIKAAMPADPPAIRAATPAADPPAPQLQADTPTEQAPPQRAPQTE